MTTRARALAWGTVVAVLYGISAIVSGHLSVVARRPILDGLAPPTAYRWVTPPPELASTNQPPESASARVALDARGNGTKVITTGDAQVTVILPKGAIPPAQGQTEVEVTIEPVDPATLSAPPGKLEVEGNAYLVGATYQPSGTPVPTLKVTAEVILVYPVLPNDHGGHELIASLTGKRWEQVDTNDLVSVAQADGLVFTLGYVAVAKTKGASTSPTSSASLSGGSESFPVTIVIVGLAVIVLIAGIMLGGRNARDRRSDGRR